MNTPTETAPRHPRWPHLPAQPWTYLGATVETYQACHGAPIQPGGCCDHCSTGIYECHRFRAKSGEVFVVGSTCVGRMLADLAKNGGKSNALQAAANEARKAKNAKARERNATKAAALSAAVGEALSDETVRAALSARPSPNQWRAAKGETALDWATWMHENGGQPAHRDVMRLIDGTVGRG